MNNIENNGSNNITTLSKFPEFSHYESKWMTSWEAHKTYQFDETSGGRIYAIDTPPPTVSGNLHIGHLFSYTQTDILARFHRMQGKTIFYPMGWDDNGLPTEKRIQELYSIRCDPSLPYESNAHYKTGSQPRNASLKAISRENFKELTRQQLEIDETTYRQLWQKMGLSIDWTQTYSTHSTPSQTLAQSCFLDLYEQGIIYSSETPVPWDTDFQTGIAQADIEEKQIQGQYHFINFALADSNKSFTIATTRPELLPACIGIVAHPSDERYKNIIGQKAMSPLFEAPIPIIADEKADPTKGTGIAMICTFGDSTDIELWQKHKLPLKQIITQDGRLKAIHFGEAPFISHNPKRANSIYQKISGMALPTARKAILCCLSDSRYATRNGQPFIAKPSENIKHAVKFYEKGKQPLELFPARQWFFKTLDYKEALLSKANEITWKPAHMKKIFENWTHNLKHDWCISRQRFHGIPIPLWYPIDGYGKTDYNKPIFPESSQIPIDPFQQPPLGFSKNSLNQPNGYQPSNDILDTWFTSSLSPMLNSKWMTDPQRHKKLFPASIRPQAHEIIRTWAFYTILQSHIHQNRIPWKKILISGWVTARDGGKISKSRGTPSESPHKLIEQYGADSIRYWAGQARLGKDTQFSIKEIKTGKRIITKLYNAARFIHQLPIPSEIHPTQLLDHAFLAKLSTTIAQATKHLEEDHYADALHLIQSSFFNDFADNYLELSKARAKGGEKFSKEHHHSAQNTLWRALSIYLRLFAPYFPFITEEIWSWSFSKAEEGTSIHLSSWPQIDEHAQDIRPFTFATECLSKIRKRRAELNQPFKESITKFTIQIPNKNQQMFLAIKDDLGAVSNCERIEFEIT